MEANWLIERLDNPALLKKGDEQRLRELIAAYPYFPAPYLLLAKTLKEQNHPAFDQLLPFISLQAFDRKRLFKLIHEEQTIDHRPWTIAEEEVEVEVEEDVEGMRGLGDEEMRGVEENDVVRPLSEEPAQSLPKGKTPGQIEPQNPEPRTLARRSFSEGGQNPIPRFAVDFTEVEKTEEEPVQSVHEELHEIPFLLTMDHGPWTMEEEAEDNGIRGQVDVETRGHGDEEVEENDVVRRLNEEPAQNPEPITPNPNTDRVDFIHWLEKLEPVKKVEEVRGLGDEENNMVRHTERSRSTTDETETKSTEDQNPEPLSAEALAKEDRTQDPTSDSIIDKFIETNPSVSRVRERFYDPAVQAKESERLDESLITETMARIFVKQEKYERALDAYRKLQLKYPQKSDYFAALIAEINSKIN